MNGGLAAPPGAALVEMDLSVFLGKNRLPVSVEFGVKPT
jgi:hypothetical protein